jgi:CRP/FNR family transcriptional regulator, cyclic AMP receptor protein
MTLRNYLKEKAAFTNDDMKLISDTFTEVSFDKKTMLLEEGNICRHLFFITKGLVKTYFIDRNGQEVIINFASENWWVTDIHSFEENKASRFYIEAMEDTECLVITAQEQYALFDKVPKLERFFRMLLQKHTGALQDRLFEHIAATAEDRYDSFLERYPSLQSRIPQNQIASYIGVSPEFLSRIRKRKVGK